MDSKELESYRKAGKIASEIREWSKELVKKDARLLDIAENIEAKIKEKGGEIAFPVNTCLNDVTAHYTPKYNDETKIMKDDVVTIDLGVHIDGFIADTAYTIDLSGKYKDMIKANKEALDSALALVKPGALVSEIGKTVNDTIRSYGFKPIENLTGHEVKKYDLHAGLSIPNIEVPYKWRIEEGMVLAIEPFATNGYGRVIESRNAEIFSIVGAKPTRNKEARLVLEEMAERELLPFAERWLVKKIPPLRLSLAMRELAGNGSLQSYPVLHEKEKGIVTQFEHTVVVTKEGCEITTE